MATLQNAIDSNGSSNTCGLHNALKIVEGYILKQQAEEALNSANLYNYQSPVNSDHNKYSQQEKPTSLQPPANLDVIT